MAEWETSSDWPVPLPYAVLHGRIQVPRNDGADGGTAPDLDRYMYDAVLTASIPQVHYIDTGDPRLFVLAPIPVKINQAGQLYGLDGQPGISLVPTDGAGGKLNHTGWTWTLAPSEDADELVFDPLTFAAPSSAVIDIALVAGEPVSAGEGIEVARAMAAAAAIAAERAIENAGSASEDVAEARLLAGQVAADKGTVSTLAGQAASSAANAKTSETNAAGSATAAKASETAAKASETNAKTSETNAKTSETNAKTSETKAKTSETNAATSAAKAKTSETNAKTSETNAKTSETNAATSAETIAQYADQIKSAAEIDQKIATAVAGKADKSHTHVSADITDAVDNAGEVHVGRLVKVHPDGGLWVPIASIKQAGSVTNKYWVEGQLKNKADSSHTHSIGDVSGLQDALDGKADATALGGVSIELMPDSQYQGLPSKNATTLYFTT